MKEFYGFKEITFSPVFEWECLLTTTMETRKRNEGDAMVFMALMFLCCFFIFGMSEMMWIILDTG
jgi:hypothetical protein